MGGEVTPIRPEPKAGPGVGWGRGGGLGARVQALEARMDAVEQGIKTAVDNTAELLAIANGAKTVAGFVQRHGPTVLKFGAGVMTAAGVGNPAVWKFITSFFGG